jgi:hypothetical protein
VVVVVPVVTAATFAKCFFNVYNFFKNYMYEEKRSSLGFSACQELTAQVHCFARMHGGKKGKEEDTEKVFLPSRKHINFKKERQT